MPTWVFGWCCIRVSAAALTAAAVVTTSSLPVLANPTGGTVVAGSATIASSPGAVNVGQTSNRAVINWQSFSIGKGQTTTFTQPSSTSAVLNRVTSADPSKIFGTLQSNGQVYLLNPNGILVGPNGTIDTGSFIGSTLGVDNAAFMGGGALDFFGPSTARIVNLGAIRAASGDVILVGAQVSNKGTITAPNGTAALGSGSQVLYAPGGDTSLVIAAPAPAAAPGAAVDNAGFIAAAQAELQAAGSPYALAVNNSGLISATTVHDVGGRVLLDGGAGSTVVSGTIHADGTGSGSGGSILVKGGDTTFTGTVTARGGALGGDGGSADFSGATVQFLGTVDMSAPHGKLGTVLLDPVNVNVDGLLANSIDTALATTNFTVAATNEIFVDGSIAQTTGTGTLTLDAPTIVVTSPTIDVPHGAVTFQNTSGTTTGSSLTQSVVNLLDVSAVNINGPFATVALNGQVAGTLNVNLGGAGVASLTATNANNTFGALNLFSGNTMSGAFQAATTTDLTVSGQLSAGSFALTAGGNLTLQPATQLTSTGGTTTLASTGGVFINGAGSGALAGPGRKILYTTSDANGFTDGGLGYEEFNGVAFGSDPLGTGNVTYVVNATNLPFMTISAVNFSRLYGAVDNFMATYSGGSASDLSTAPQFGIQQGSDANVGTYTIVPFGAISATHRLTYVDGTLTVTPAPLTITALNQSMTYGSTAGLAPSAASVSYTGLVNGDTSSVITGLQLSSPAGSTSNVGTYTIVPFGGSASNYSISYANGTMTVTPAPLTITALPATMQYGDIPVFGPGSVSYSGLVNGQTGAVVSGLQLTTPVTSLSNVGTYGLTLSGATAPNYAIILMNGTMTVTPATLYFTVNPGTTNVGSAFPTFGATFTGFKNGDGPSVVSGMEFSTNAPTSAPLGTYTISAVLQTGPAFGPTGGYGLATNYTLVPANGSPTAVFSIVPCPATSFCLYAAPGTNSQTQGGAYSPPPTPVVTVQATLPGTTPQLSGTSFAISPPAQVSAQYDFLGLSGTAGFAEEQSIISAFVTASSSTSTPFTAAQVEAALMDPNQQAAMEASLLPFMFTDLNNILTNVPQAQWTPAQAGLVTAVENYIQQQRESAAANAVADYQTWLDQQHVQFSTLGINSNGTSNLLGVYVQAAESDNAPTPPSSFLQEMQVGFTLTNDQLNAVAKVSNDVTAIAQLVQGGTDASLLTGAVPAMYEAAAAVPSLAPALGKISPGLAVRSAIIARTGTTTTETVAEGTEAASEAAEAAGAIAGTVLAGAGAVTAVAATIFDGVVGGIAFANISDYNAAFNGAVKAAAQPVTASDLTSMSANNLLSYLTLMMGTNGSINTLQAPPAAPSDEGF